MTTSLLHYCCFSCRKRRPWAAMLAAWLLATPALQGAVIPSWATTGDVAAVSERLAHLLGDASRTAGSEGNLALEAYVAQQFADSGHAHGEMVFTAPAFLPGETRITVGDATFSLETLHPSVFRPGNFREPDFSTTLIDGGMGTEADLAALDGVDLAGSLVLLDFNSGRNWERFLRFGVKGFIFSAADIYGPRESYHKVHTSEASVPRFFADAETAAALRDHLGDNRHKPARIQAEPSRWERRDLRNLWVLIPGSDPELQTETVLITATLDANSIVPAQATGAQAGANLLLLLQMLESFSEQPPARSLLLAAVNARTLNFLGDRVLAWHLLSPESQIEEIRNALADDFREQELMVQYYSRFSFDPEDFETDRDFLIDLRTLSDMSTGRQITIKDPVVALSKRDVNEIKTRQLAYVRAEDELRVEKQRLLNSIESEASNTASAQRERIEAIRDEMNRIDARRKVLDTELDAYVNVLTLFNRVGIQTELGDLSPTEVDILRGYVESVLERSRRSAELNRHDLATSSRNARIREVLAGQRVSFVVSLDLVWSDPRIGFSSGLSLAATPWAARWGRNTVQVSQNLAETTAKPNLLADTMTNLGGLPERHYLPANSQAVISYHLASRTPAFSLQTLYANWGHAFTPVDRMDQLDPAIVAESSAFAMALMRELLSDPLAVSSLETPPGVSRLTRMWSCLVKAYKYDEFAAGVVPEIPVPNSAIVLSTIRGIRNLPSGADSGFLNGDVVEKYLALSDERAIAIVYGIRHHELSSSVFRFDDDFTRIDHAVDAGETHRKTNSDLTVSDMRVLSVIPVGEELTVFDRLDTPMIAANEIYVRTYFPLSSTRNSEPRKYAISGALSGLSNKKFSEEHWGPVSFFAEPGDRLQVLTEFKQLALNVTPENPHGVGFAHTGELGPDFFRQALRDARQLNRHRYRGFRGITDELVEAFLERGEASEADVDAAAAESRHLDYLRAQHDALGAQAKAYAQITSITNDMLKAVIFFMALLLPFCFFIQKLLFKTTRIERQMAYFAILFVICYLVFRFIHPAFAVAQAPEAMFIAFVMGGLGLFVIAILHGRFEGEMQLLFSTLTGTEQSEAGYSMVSQQALMIGVNNMKRRRIRTLLTTATIVLVTFTMLAFTSVSRRMSPTMIPRDSLAPYSGIMYHWPGGERMDAGTHQILNELVRDDLSRSTRYWLMPPTQRDQIAVYRVEREDGNQSALIEGALGLQQSEHGFLGTFPLSTGHYFSADDAMEVIISSDLAAFLELGYDDVGQARLVFKDRRFKLVGIVDDDRLRNIRDINGLSILPIQQLLLPGGADEQEDALDDESGIFYVNTVQLLIFPAETARRMGGEPYSLSVKFPDETPIWPIIDRLLTATSARFFVASREPFTVGDTGEGREQQPGIYFIGSGYRTSIGGLAMLIIPLLIASTIILNTMLGSVFERKNEIAVYNAVGLNPTHIGLFFLAESFVYAIIGSVGGYLIGQVLSITLNHFGWVEDINLNFSSLSVAYVILFTVSVVLLSTLYPAVVATKAAVPSGKRKWSMPDHDGHTMTVIFPFIYQPELVTGVMFYLANYLEQFNEASIGDLIVQRESLDRGNDQAGRPTYQLRYHVALAPFDLGVTQTVIFEAAYNEKVAAYRVVMTNRRVSGQDSNWVTTNKPFLERLRKFLLHWRNLKPAEHALFVQRGNALFAEDN